MADQNFGLENLGFKNIGKIFRNLTYEELIEHEVKKGEAKIGQNGCVMIDTGKYTGRSPNDKFTVDEPSTTDNIWWGPVNRKISEANFNELEKRVMNFLDGSDLYMFDVFSGANEDTRMPCRIITKKAWHAHFVKNMFIEPEKSELEGFAPEFTILNACEYLEEKDYKELGLNSDAFVIFNLAKKFAIIGGTQYAGEMKKGIFGVMNYFLPLKGIMSMHCSANIGKDGDTALFFGLSGTGKTTLSTDPNRPLIGDDEHGWDDKGIFNLEGGCYAKTINLSAEHEPEIYGAIKHKAILENVVYDEDRVVDYDDDSITENTRVSYPLTSIENAVFPSVGGHPKNIIFLTCDAFGVLPPVSELTADQASYHFLSGYTAKVAGTERGVTEPQATFSTCFGAAFMILRPKVYGELLAEKIKKHNVKAYLVNTGWTGGPCGVGSRMSLPATRTIITAILDGSISNCEWETDEILNLKFPKTLEGVDAGLLNPKNTWEDKAAYDEKRLELAKMFVENFEKYAADAPELKAAGPRV